MGAMMNFSASEHQAAQIIWGAQIDDNGCFHPIDLV
ncbi:hypothetical protein M2321_002580 [Rhodoblastus acidophilus]|nr:hypothetical protein [Rhodoblastus acidophilus]